jgi:hypothetical protein
VVVGLFAVPTEHVDECRVCRRHAPSHARRWFLKARWWSLSAFLCHIFTSVLTRDEDCRIIAQGGLFEIGQGLSRRVSNLWARWGRWFVCA